MGSDSSKVEVKEDTGVIGNITSTASTAFSSVNPFGSSTTSETPPPTTTTPSVIGGRIRRKSKNKSKSCKSSKPKRKSRCKRK